MGVFDDAHFFVQFTTEMPPHGRIADTLPKFDDFL